MAFSLTIIILLAFLLRFSRLETLAPFVHDNARELLTTYKMYKFQEWVFRGPVFSIVWGFLSPIYYYLLLPIFIALKFHPLAPTLVTLTTNLAGVVVLMFVVQRVFKNKVASLAAGAIYAVSLAVIKNGAAGWNPSLLPPFTLLAFYAVYKIVNQEEKYLILLSFCLAMLVSFHPSGFFLLPGLLILYLMFKPKFNRRTLFYSGLVAGILAGVPYAIQEKKFAFWTLKRLWEFVTDPAKKVPTPLGESFYNFTHLLLKSISQVLLATSNIWGLLAAALVLTFLIVSAFRLRRRHPRPIALLAFFNLSHLVVFGFLVKFKNTYGTSSWWLHTIFVPLIVILVGVGIAKLITKKPFRLTGLVVLAGVVYLNLAAYSNYNLVLNLKHKKEVAQFLRQDSKGENFDVYGSDRTPLYYLMWYAEPDPKLKETYFEWLNHADRRYEPLMYLVTPKDDPKAYEKVRVIYANNRKLSTYEKIYSHGERDIYRVK